MMGPGGRPRNPMGPGATTLHAMGQIDTTVVPPAQQQQQMQMVVHQQPPAAPATGDLLGFDDQGQPQQQQQQVSAGQVTVNITTSGAGAVAPSIAGIGKIEPGAAPNSNLQNNKPKRKVIYVPTYSCNGGLDTKFNHYARSARPTNLHGILTPEEYEREITTLNDKIKKARATKIDMALLATGALMVPLAIWAPRHAKQIKRRRKLIEEGCWEFNERMSMDGNRNNVRMICNRAKVVGGGESYLTIEEVESESREDVSKKFD